MAALRASDRTADRARAGLASVRARLWRVVAGLLVLCSFAALPAQAQIGAATLMADQVFVDATGRLVASGAVEIWHRSTRVTARRVVFDRRSGRLQIEGPITLSDGPDTLILADAAQLDGELRAGIITGARMVIDQHLQVAAARLTRHEDGVTELDSVVASSCPVCASNPTPLWEIRAESVQHDQSDNRLLFRRAQLRMAGVPVFYLPRLSIPAPDTDRQRGILRPEIDMGSDLGLRVGLPYFIPLGPTRDLTLTPQVSTGGMVGLGLRFRLARQNGGLEVGGQVSRDRLIPGRLRGYAYLRSLFHLGGGWRLSSDLILTSDRQYLETYDISDDARLSADVTLERIRRDQAIRARALAFYSLRATDDNRTLPNAVLEAELVQRHALAGGEARFELGARGFQRLSTTDGTAGRDVARAWVQLGWRRSAVLPGGVLATGAVQGRLDHVRVGDDGLWPDPVNRSALQGMVELRWPWAAVTEDGARHVIEPVVQLVGSRRTGPVLPNDDHTMPELDAGNLFALDRYSGQDRPDDGTRLNSGLRWTRHDAAGWSSEALVGRIWRTAALDFDPAHRQPLGLTRSDWLLAGRLSTRQGHALSLRLLMDDDRRLSRAESNLALSWNATTLGTRFLYVAAAAAESRATDLNEWSLDLSHRFASGWTTRLGWDYDLSQDLFASARTGVGFSNECLMVDLSLARHFVTATNPSASTRFNLRVAFLGIGGRAPVVNGRTCRA